MAGWSSPQMSMFSGELLLGRIDGARRYVAARHDLRSRVWLQAFREYQKRKLDLYQTMALLHPEHYPEPVSGTDPRGRRAFTLNASDSRCYSEVIWGYECPIVDTEAGVVADHIFPYALGGVTQSTNRITLCRWHNSIKTCDIHFFPWERGEPPWVAEALCHLSKSVSLSSET